MGLQKTYFLLSLLFLSLTVRAQKEIPVLCYHQVRDWNAGDSKSAKAYIVPVERFRQHMKMLRDSGYHVILPDQLLHYLSGGTSLPTKPILITFDDGTDSQYMNALPELQKYQFGATFFIMTVTLDRPRYLSRKQVKELSDKGHVIGCHTWDHHNVTGYKADDWNTQLTKPTMLLEQITGKQVKYFAYPFGAWDTRAISELKKHKYLAAFQLTGKKDTLSPLFTIRRLIASGYWSGKELDAAIKKTFK